MKLGIVDVGGGYRGIYAAGVLDYCLEQGIRFDVGIGVSAGSANLASFAAGQKGRNFRFYTEYGARKEYAGISNFLKKKTFIDLDYVYDTLSGSEGENPLDYQAFLQNKMDYYVVATDAVTGQPRYFSRQDLDLDSYDPLKASCAIPFVCHPYQVQGRDYFDGALSDPIPIGKAFSLGCDKVVLLLTKPEDFVRTPEMDEKLAKMIRRDYPVAAQRLCQRAETYNTGVALAELYASQGRLLIVAPDDTCGVTTLTRDRTEENHQHLVELYQKGFADGRKIKDFLEQPGKKET